MWHVFLQIKQFEMVKTNAFNLWQLPISYRTNEARYERMDEDRAFWIILSSQIEEKMLPLYTIF
jgi:hypothetical protein